MRIPLRSQLRLLQGYALVSAGVLVFVSIAAFTRQPATAQRIDELTVQRINVVDANGTLRMVIANKDRMHPGVIDGVTMIRPRPVAGLLFFNDEGDEVGGLAYSGQLRDGAGAAGALLAFDQWKQDQTIGISYSEAKGQRSAGLQVWDRSDTQPLSELVRGLNAANALPEGPGRDAAVKAVRAKAQPGPRRVFVGKNSDKSATVSLADAAGRPRLVMRVDAGGAATIDFLDADGKTVQSLPAPR